VTQSEKITAAVEPASIPVYSLWQLVKYALRLGTLGLGGPVALCEINVSSVSPFPDSAVAPLAAATFARTQTIKRQCPGSRIAKQRVRRSLWMQ